MKNIPRTGQLKHLGGLDQILLNLQNQLVKTILESINIDLKCPLRVDATSTPSLVVNIGPAIVDNTVSDRQRSIPFINDLLPSFTSGTVTFPAANGGTITVSPGSNVTLTLPSNEYVKILLSLDENGQIVVSQGTSNAVEANALVPAPIADTLSIAYISLFNNAGTVQAVSQDKIFQFAGGGGSGGTPATGYAEEETVANGVTTHTITFPTPLTSANYVVIAGFVNTTDASPQFQALTITNKTVNGFTVKWNAPTDSANYSIGYLLPTIMEQVGEEDIASGVSTVTVSVPTTLSSGNYVVVAQLVNMVDGLPQFQPVTITAKSGSSFTAKWNANTDSANYRLAYHLAHYQ